MNGRTILGWLLFIAILSFELTTFARSDSRREGKLPPCTEAQFQRVKEEASRGLASSQKTLADDYAGGRCGRQDYAQAAFWYRRAAQQGNADAQFALAMFLLEGKEVAQDPVDAAAWFRRAAEQNHSQAQYALGSLCVQGRGLPKDLVQGYMWIRISSPAPDRHTQDALAGIAKSMSADDVQKAEAAAGVWTKAHPRSRAQRNLKK